MKMLLGFIYCLRGIWSFRAGADAVNVFKLFLAEYIWPKGKVISLKLRNLQHNICIRSRTSDCILVRTVLLRNGGEYPFFVGYSPRTIIDAGANIGLASIFFKSKYPDAKIIAIEPDADNCRMFEMNTHWYTGINLLQGALWPDANALLKIRNPGEEKYAYQVEQSADGMEAITISGICHRFDIKKIDILKIDIEGAERELFSRNVEWLDMADNILIETHDRVAPGASKAVLKAVAPRGFSFSFRGENAIFMREYRRCR